MTWTISATKLATVAVDPFCLYPRERRALLLANRTLWSETLRGLALAAGVAIATFWAVPAVAQQSLNAGRPPAP